MKETHFFSHDYAARHDPKLQEVMMDYGVAGIGAYWCVIEQLYEQGGELPLSSVKAIAFSLHIDTEMLTRIIEKYGLFETEGDVFFSPSASRRLAQRKSLSEKRRTAGMVAHEKRSKEQMQSKCIANAEQMQSKCIANAEEEPGKCNAIKENKNKIKENNNNISLCTARVTREEREKILEVFSLERNFLNPLQEVERFIAYYEASDWHRGDDSRPVRNKAALAHLWKPQMEGCRYPPDILPWLADVYRRTKETAGDATFLLTEIERIAAEPHGELTIFCSGRVATAIENSGQCPARRKLRYMVKKIHKT